MASNCSLLRRRSSAPKAERRGVGCIAARLRRAPARLGNDLLAALGTAARKNLLPTRGLHTGAEARGAFALDLARLISAFHGDRPEAADIPEKRAGRLRIGVSGCQYNPVRNR